MPGPFQSGYMRSARSGQSGAVAGLPVTGTKSNGAWVKYQQSTGKFIYRNPNFLDLRDGSPGHPTAKCACDTKQVTDGVIAGGTLNQVTSATASFQVGQWVNIDIPSGTGFNLGATITSVAGTTATLSAAANGAVTGATVTYGTDDTANAQTIFQDASALGVPVQAQGSMLISQLTCPATGTVTAVPGATIYQTYSFSAAPLFGNFPATATDLTFEKLRLVGDANPSNQGSQWAIALQPAVSGSRVRVRDCYITGFCQAAVQVKNCDMVEIAGNFVTKCATRPGGSNAITLNTTFTSPLAWIVRDNIVQAPAAACIDVLVQVGQAPGPVSDITITGNVCSGATNFSGIALETNGGARNVTIAGNTIMDCLVGISYGDSSGGSFQNSYADLQNVTITGNTVTSRLFNTTGIGGFASNTTISGNTVLAYKPFTLLGSAGIASRATNVNVTGNTFVSCSQAGQPALIAQGTRVDNLVMVGNLLQTESEVDYLSIIGATAGTFTLTVTDAQGHVFGPTAAIAFNATPATITTALQAVLPTAINNSIIALSHGTLPASIVEIQYLNVLGSQPVALTGNFSGLTGGTPAITQTIVGAVADTAIGFTDLNRPQISHNTIIGAGRQAISLTDGRDGSVQSNVIYESDARNFGAALGAAIRIIGATGQRGCNVMFNEISDRRVDATGTAAPLMTYGVDSSGLTSGTVNTFLNPVTGAKTAKSNGSFTLLANDANGMA